MAWKMAMTFPQVDQEERKTQSMRARFLYAVVIMLTTFDASSQAARRDQNRIAQREFRLRKQQRVSLHIPPAQLP
jgi:hypothetical protein